MKKFTTKIFVILVITGIIQVAGSCTRNLLDQVPTTDMGADQFWKTEEDATTALVGAYSSIRPLFDRDYYLDGMGDYVRTRGTSATSGDLRRGDAYQGIGYNPSGSGGAFSKYFRHLYGGIHRANYVIENITTRMLPNASGSSVTSLEAVIGEARLLRGMVYFKLISWWGDVPYIDHIIYDNAEVTAVTRTPMSQIVESIRADFSYAFEKLPVSRSAAGRAGKPAALAFRGKLELYWASWNKFGWPELAGFTPNADTANAAFARAADDFRAVADNYGLVLFRNGEPGEIDALGKADILPNYFYLFQPLANNDPEIIMGFTHGGTGTGQGEELMRDVAGRSHEGSQCWVHPRYEVADRYQLVATGDYATPLIPMNPDVAGARTTPNSAVNPASYVGRDYRMKATLMWDFEVSIGLNSLRSTGWCPFIYKTWNQPVTIDGVNYITYNTDGNNSGYVFRKFLRDYPGQGRSDGDYNFPVMRLADVYLMYAEADNEINGPQAYAIELVNRVRYRGNLPQLTAAMTADKDAFFAAIEQERIIELLGEGQRSFDIRRWRALERVWCPPYGVGVWRIDSHGANISQYYLNQPETTYERFYIFQIPEAERDRNPNLTQNTPWL